MMMAPVEAIDSSMTSPLRPAGAKNQSLSPLSSPPGPAAKPSSDIAMSRITLPMPSVTSPRRRG